jgi:diaminohydroxyphosphoribosylaminopyrimidine deaminase / 5-amino-6-(5-phosphoribosylamino)uracil reductase
LTGEEKLMRRALEIAEKAIGQTFPNPLVGAVLVQGGDIVGEGYHRGPGEPHAEMEAIAAAGRRAKGATLYLNLEPCCHYGRTPPCTKGIIDAGISTVVFGIYDPDERVRGKGASELRAHGIDVHAGLCAREALELNLHYTHRSLTGRPFVFLKLAPTLDGRLTAGPRRYLSGEKEQAYVHRLRAWTEAVAVGIGTIMKDKPRLDRRFYRGGMAPPVRMVFDSGLRFPRSYPWLAKGEQVIIYCLTGASARKKKILEQSGAAVVPLPVKRGGVSLSAWRDDVTRRGITSVLVEGGGAIATSFIAQGIFERLVLAYAPLIGGTGGVLWYQERRAPGWLTKGELILRHQWAMDDDLIAVYDTKKISEYLSIVTDESAIARWAP